MNQDKNNIKEEIEDFDFKEFINICLNKWWWFAICLVCSVGIALFYLYRKQPVYQRYEQVLVNNSDSGGGISDVTSAFSSLGLFSKNSNVYNELLTMTSPAVLYQVADSLQLDMNYAERNGLRTKTLYGSNQPFRVDMLDIPNQGAASFRIRISPEGDMEFYKFARITPDGKVKYPDEIKVSSGTELVTTPLGQIQISPNPLFKGFNDDKERVITVNKMPMQNTVEIYGLKLKGDLADDDADIIELSIEDVSVERAVDVLNYVLYIYNQDWAEDKNKIANATSRFIDDRLKVIETQLGNVDQTIVEYIKNSGTPDVAASTAATLELGTQLEQKLMDTSNELSIAYYMKDFLTNNDNITTILPANLGIASGDLTVQITTYNDLLLSRNSIMSNSSENNPLVQNYDRQLEQMRSAIEKSVDNRIKNLEKSVENIKEEISQKTAKMAAAPESNLPLLTEERQQQVLQNLYLFLLQKREENELTQKFTTDNLKIITPPVGPLKPVSPRKGLIIVIAGIIGLGIPIILLYYLETNSATIKSHKDMEDILVPSVGEIPQEGNIKKIHTKNPLKHQANETPLVVVETGKQDKVNEAFRIVRGNLESIMGKNSGSKVVMITSFNPGSGKTFIAYNLGLSFALRNKRTLIIDCDLRQGTASKYMDMPQKGLSAYLEGQTNDWENLINKTDNKNLSILPIGIIPPNPTELLEDGRLEKLLEEARKEYDIILLDCPSVNIVADTQIIAPLADMTIFVVRVGLFEKETKKELESFYENNRFANMTVVVNGTVKKQ